MYSQGSLKKKKGKNQMMLCEKKHFSAGFDDRERGHHKPKKMDSV